MFLQLRVALLPISWILSAALDLFLGAIAFPLKKDDYSLPKANQRRVFSMPAVEPNTTKVAKRSGSGTAVGDASSLSSARARSLTN